MDACPCNGNMGIRMHADASHARYLLLEMDACKCNGSVGIRLQWQFTRHAGISVAAWQEQVKSDPAEHI
ncbi:hypothetical protein V6N12_035698 [Hibiscus sabdariffa]|uniref:Uncharacterized protein n=1 Tax=Hibiscus sabdariffa TaxID=183260 RepID=A0ABR2EQX9_9ROSI